MDNVFKRILDNHFSDLKGTVVQAKIPVPQALINELLQAGLKGKRSISSIQIAVHPQNRVSANVKTTLLPWALNLTLKLDTSLDLGSYSSPKLRAWMENNQLLGSLGAFFNALPEGIRLYGNQLVMDLAVLLGAPEQRKYLELIKSVRIQTEAGKVILDIQAAIE